MNSISRCGARLVFSLLLFLVVDLATNSVGTPGALGQNIRPVTITRLFWQDRETAKLSYADLVTTNKWNLNRGWVSGFPGVDVDTQSIHSISQSGGMVMVGIRKQTDAAGSGWVSIDPGAFEEPHGSHNHWKYSRLPAVTNQQLAVQQGNPATLDVFDGTFYVSMEGGTESGDAVLQVAPQQLKMKAASNQVRAFSGGGGGPVAVVGSSVCYASYSDAQGDDIGRVDVVNLRGAGDQPSYSFKVPGGAIRAVTTNSGKVFFATADGVYWVNADLTASQNAASVVVNSVQAAQAELSEDRLVTQSFANHRNWVVFTSGSGSNAGLYLINAAVANPYLAKRPVSVAEGLTLTAPEVVLSLGKRYALVFHDRLDLESKVPEQLTVWELDPNRDQDFSDATIRLTMPVGASKVNGGQGHHSVCFDAFGRHAIITNPGDGVLTVLSLQNLKVQAKFQVGGIPEGTIAVGAAEHFH